MAIVDLKPGAEPRIVDEGGDLLMLSIDLRGAAHFPTGITSAITPRWSPDGRWIAFLKRTDGVTQLWRAMADGSGSAPLTHSAIDVVDFRIAPDGSSIAFATAAGLAKSEAAIGQEGLSGFHYDDRWSPFAQNEPFPQAPLKRAVKVLDLANGGIREANASEHAALASDSDLIATAGAPAHGPMEPGLKISATELTGGARAGRVSRALAQWGDRNLPRCSMRRCDAALVAAGENEGRVSSAAKVGPMPRPQSTSGTSARGSVRRLYLTDDVLADCAPDGATLICLREGSLEPRRLERLDPATGSARCCSTPIPNSRSLTLGQRPTALLAQRLRHSRRSPTSCCRSATSKGKRYPLVVVQYDTRGFLRGGTGDEYPIQAFANRGYAVLSFKAAGCGRSRQGREEFHRRTAPEPCQFCRPQERPILARGAASSWRSSPESPTPARSESPGSATGRARSTWALIHSTLFAAAAMSSCCIDTTLAMRVGPAAARRLSERGLSRPA